MLERRELLADMGLDIQLFNDVNGAPSTTPPITLPKEPTLKPVQVGDEFWVRILVEDLSPRTESGVISLPLNLAWDPNYIEFIGTSPDPDKGPNPDQDSISIEDNNVILTPSFTLQRFVDDIDLTAADPLNANGFNQTTYCNVLGLRGGALPAAINGAAIGAGLPESFSDILFKAIAETPSAGTPFMMQLAGSMAFIDADELEDIIGYDSSSTVADGDNRIFRYIHIEDTDGLASLSGFVYLDADKDGNYDTNASTGVPTEYGLPNVRISLEGPVSGVTYTAPDGGYQFDNLTAGTYKIIEEQPVCFLDGPESLGVVLPGKNPRGSIGEDEFYDIDLALNEHGINYNFGELGFDPSCITKRMLLTSTPPTRELIAETLGLTAVTVRGTTGSDRVHIQATENDVTVTVNSEPNQVFPTSEVDVIFLETDEGQDAVTVVGSTRDEVARLLPGYGTIEAPRIDSSTNGSYSVLVDQAEEVTFNGGEGTNQVVLHDSPQNDSLVVGGSTATLTASDLNRMAIAFEIERLRAISASGGSDTLDEQSPTNFVFTSVGDWQEL
ncbi:MAG: hypothetical protein JW829_15480 [Pirellulales bacterium]|nr:hypothetical protein [Pirellulales bacterium]